VTVPQSGELAHRNRTHWGFIGFMNAYLLTGDDRYLDAWRRQADVINAQGKTIDGRWMTPRMYGDDGWYAYEPGDYNLNALELYFLSMRPTDRPRVGDNSWLRYLAGDNPHYPSEALRRDLDRVRERVVGMRADTTTPDTRLADDPMSYNPASVSSLIELMQGGLHIERRASVLHCRLRYFDPVGRRAGIPEDVAALVDSLTGDTVAVTLVNVNQVEPRTLVVQAGAYAEHEFQVVTVGETEQTLRAPQFAVHLGPGCGARLQIGMRRYVRQPTLAFPFDR
jgi:hypothetical protein